MKLASMLIGLIACSLSLALPTTAAPTPQRPPTERGNSTSPHRSPSVLAEVQELDQPVTYSETRIPLGELIQKVVDDTGARLTAAKEVADEPVAVVVKELPARELLEQLADLLDYRWSRRGSGVQAGSTRFAGTPSGVQAEGSDGGLNARPGTREAGRARLNAQRPHYEIYQDLASKQREQALREAAVEEAGKRFQEALKRTMELAAMPQEDFDRFLADSKQAQKEMSQLPPDQLRALLRTPAGHERSERYFAALNIATPVQRAMARLLGRLTTEQWRLLQAEEPLTFSTNPERGELPLPPEVGRGLRAAQPTLDSATTRTRPTDSNQAEPARIREKNLQEEWPGAAGYRITLHMQVSRARGSASVSLEGTAEMIRTGAGRPFAPLMPGLRLLLVGRRSEALQAIRERSPEQQAALANDPVLGVAKSVATGAKPQPDFTTPPQPTSWRLRELLPDLAQIYGVNFIADAYLRSGGVVFARALDEPINLYLLLDQQQHSHNIVWDRVDWTEAGGAPGHPLLRLRSPTWFVQRPREVPMRLVQRWRSLYEEYGALPLEEWLRAPGTLSDTQLEGTSDLNWSGDLPPTANILTASMAKNMLRLFGALTPDQRQFLWRGAMIPLARMNDRQRALFAAAAHEAGFFRKTPMDITDPAAAGLSVATASEVRVEKQHGNGSRPNTRMQLIHLPMPGGPRPPPGASRAPETVQSSPPGASAAVTVRRYPLTLIHFQLHYGPDQQDTVPLTVPASDPSVHPGPSDTRPATPTLRGDAG